jgi:long-chain fatty acid transport protein
LAGRAGRGGRWADRFCRDTWHGALGAQLRASEKWQFTAGVAYDSSAVRDATRTITMPMGQAWRFGLGAQWEVSKAVSLQAAYEFLWAGDMPVVQDSAYRGRVSGGFNDAYFSFFTMGLNWKF